MNAVLEREVSRVVLLGRALEHALHSPHDWTAWVGTDRLPVQVRPDDAGVTLRVDADPSAGPVTEVTLCVHDEPLIAFPVDLRARHRPYRVEFRLALHPEPVRS